MGRESSMHVKDEEFIKNLVWKGKETNQKTYE